MTQGAERPRAPNRSFAAGAPAVTPGRTATSRLTIRDVAVAAGVSAATVSRALRGLEMVEPRTREHIVAVARRLDYSVSLPASRLATGRTGTIGIVTPFVGRWYFTEVFAGIDERLRSYDVDLLIHTTEETADAGLPAAAARMRHRVDGALVIGMSPGRRGFAELRSVDVPLVLLGASCAGLSSVSINDRAAARGAVEHLIERGHRRIGLITGRRLPTPILPENSRLRGYLEVLAQNSLPAPQELRVAGHFTCEGGQAAMRQLLGLPEPPTAVFAMSDEMAYGAMRALAVAGIRPGGDRAAGDIAVVGFDGHDLSDAFDLTTVAQPVRQLGRAAADMLMETVLATGAVDGRTCLVLPTSLQLRGSTRPPDESALIRRNAVGNRPVTK
jgi:DNA-binding LacI/PurR family transcriptional regulator